MGRGNTPLAGSPEGNSKVFHAGKALLGLFGKGFEHHQFHLGWQRGHLIYKPRRWRVEVLRHQFWHCPLKGTHPC
ncbi:hypothetical protein KSB_90080 [Ktedonobacter robiniae]|uniref:Uncharacterized protein n=1 Tax=Ktedonobacter robiniae TaxID=2778365 RepID=A0ABQ3V685_9CHLR|nr:hypothetical protein KSB_90080 [Ktedonobacter robiniae]